MAHIYCSPTWPSVFIRRREPLAGRGGGFGGWSCALHQRPHAARAWGASSIRVVPKKNVRCPGLRELLPKAWPGWLSLLHCSREGQGEQSRCLLQPTSPVKAMCKKEAHHLGCARDQVVIARPPVLIPQWRYRRSLVSKGRFAISINVICVGIRSSLPKRRYRVVIDYLCRARPPPPPRQARQDAGWFVDYDARVRI
jgi:hypothetical protein